MSMGKVVYVDVDLEKIGDERKELSISYSDNLAYS